MAEGDIGAILGTLEFDADNGETPNLVHVAGNVYGIAYRDVNGHGKVVAVSISTNGLTITLLAGTMEFEDTAAEYIDMIHITGNVFAVVYEGPSIHGWAKTVSISNDGATITLLAGSLEYYDNTADNPKIIHIAGTVYAVVYEAYGYDGTIKAISISADGSSITLLAGNVIYDATKGSRGKLIHVSGTVYAVVYQGPDFDGWLRTVNITDNGAAVTLLAGNVEFDANAGKYPDIIHVSGNVYAIAYGDTNNHGQVKTVSIDDDGATITLLAGSIEFDDTTGLKAKIIHVSGNLFVITYQGPGFDGWIKTVSISDDGATVALTGQSLEFDTGACSNPDMLFVSGNVYAIAYSGDGADGWLKTVEIETVLAGFGKHLMMMGIG